LHDHERPETHHRHLRPHLVGVACGSPLRRSSPFPLMDARSLPVNRLNIASHASGLPLLIHEPLGKSPMADALRSQPSKDTRPLTANAKLLTKQ